MQDCHDFCDEKTVPGYHANKEWRRMVARPSKSIRWPIMVAIPWVYTSPWSYSGPCMKYCMNIITNVRFYSRSILRHPLLVDTQVKPIPSDKNVLFVARRHGSSCNNRRFVWNMRDDELIFSSKQSSSAGLSLAANSFKLMVIGTIFTIKTVGTFQHR